MSKTYYAGVIKPSKKLPGILDVFFIVDSSRKDQKRHADIEWTHKLKCSLTESDLTNPSEIKPGEVVSSTTGENLLIEKVEKI